MKQNKWFIKKSSIWTIRRKSGKISIIYKILLHLPSKEMLTKSTNFLIILLKMPQGNHLLNFQILKLL